MKRFNLTQVAKPVVVGGLLLASGLSNAATLSIDNASDWGNAHSNYPASNVIDGSLAWSSRWAASGSPVNLVLDLGSVQSVSAVGISWGNGGNRTHSFEIWARASSSDSWVKVREKGDTTGATSSIESYDIDDINARYVRIKTHSNSAGSTWTNIKEVEVYGSDSNGADIPSIITDGSLFDLEGDNPHPLVNSKTLEFVPLETKFTTSGGGGWRHEYKIKSSKRISIYDTYESFSATYKMELSDGAKTIVAQTHGSTISTLMKVFVADSSESGFADSIAANGVFDVYVRLRGTDGKEVKESLCTIESGDSFDVTYENNYGTMTVSACGNSLSIQVEDDDASYFKFGNYMQTQDPYTREECGTRGDSDSWAECYENYVKNKKKATVTNVTYSSNHD